MRMICFMKLLMFSLCPCCVQNLLSTLMLHGSLKPTYFSKDLLQMVWIFFKPAEHSLPHPAVLHEHLFLSKWCNYLSLPLCLCLSASYPSVSLHLFLALLSAVSPLSCVAVCLDLTFNDSKPSAWELRLISSSSLNIACLRIMGTQNIELIRCFSCHCMEFDWRI